MMHIIEMAREMLEDNTLLLVQADGCHFEDIEMTRGAISTNCFLFPIWFKIKNRYAFIKKYAFK